MRPTKANTAGLASPLQQAEMKSILAGAWPALKPLPVFKYETPEYRATIDFDKKRGEWVCRKISFPSNTIQELRGGLREITMELPHGEAEIFTEEAEHQEQELEKDKTRRLQAMDEWRKSSESGAFYFALREHLSETQQTEIDDSLRLSLTARQLQFTPKNVAYVFDALSSAGGRFATLIAFAKRKKAEPGTDPQAQKERVVPEAEHADNRDEPLLWNRSCEAASAPDSNNSGVREQEAPEGCANADELPALSIKNVLPEQEQASPADRMASHRASQSFEIETSEIVEMDSASLGELPYQEADRSHASAGLAAHTQTRQASAGYSEGSAPHFPALEISAFQVAVFAALFLSATFAFTVGLTVGRGPLASRLREVPKSILATDAKSPTLPAPADESAAPTSTPAATIANESGSAIKPSDAAPSEKKSGENARDSEYVSNARAANVDSPGSALSTKGEVSLERSGAREHGSLAARRMTPAISTAPNLPRASTILVTRPARGSQPFRVSLPEKTIAATSSLAMSSQLSVLVSPEPGPRVAHKPARLESGDLVSFVWPRYAKTDDRHQLAETIRVRATIGQLGQVREVKFLSGSSALLPATKAAIRQWRYRPTLLDKRPVQAQQDVTIEFRPAQYSSRLSTRLPSHN